MRLCCVRRLAPSALVVSLLGCSAVSDFDYSFHASQSQDAGPDQGPPDLDAQTPVDAALRPDGAPPSDAMLQIVPDAGPVVPDANLPDGAVCTPQTCCELRETTELTCSGGLDEDCDGKIDCADTDCRQSATCCPQPSFESGDKACTDKIDNDCDGILDCAETSCAGVYGCTCKPTGQENSAFPASCTDMNDNDCDHLIDCDEKDCAGADACCKAMPRTASETGAQCTDGINNDCDADGADCADPDCRMSTDAGSVASETGAACTNGKDDDCDGLVDCKDDDCRGALECCTKTMGQESVETSCADGLNNDCDATGADCADSDCALNAACCKPVVGGESTAKLCGNGVDDDCDGLVDCADSQCSGIAACCQVYLKAHRIVLQTAETDYCADGYDNDCDGTIDCKDSDCGTGTVRTSRCGIIIIDPSPPIAETQ